MINHNQKQKLIQNWGDKAESMSCHAEVRVYDPISSWECYLYAMNPENEDEIMCLTKTSKGDEAVTEYSSINWIQGLFNEHGEGVEVDTEYRPRRTAELFKQLNKGLR